MKTYKIHYINSNFNKVDTDMIQAENEAQARELAYQSKMWGSGYYNSVKIKELETIDETKVDIPIPPSKQDHDYLYKMALVFRITFEFTELNQIAHACGFDEKIVIPEPQEFTMTQLVPFIPDDNTIKDYCRIIRENYEPNPRLAIHEIKFVGYKYIYCVRNPRIPLIGDDVYVWLKQTDNQDGQEYRVLTTIKYKPEMRRRLYSTVFPTREEAKKHKPKD